MRKLKNRKYKEVNEKEFDQIKSLLEHFKSAQVEKILKKMGNDRCYSTIRKVEKAKNFDEYLESVKKATAKRMEQLRESRGGEKKTKIDDALIEDLKGAYNKIGILLKNLQ